MSTGREPLDLSIIILNYNTASWLENVLTSIENYPPENLKQEVIVVDNASNDDSVAVVNHKFGWVHLIQSKHNEGYAAGNNRGIQAASGRYVMLLNSDAEFLRQTNIDSIISYLDDNPEIAVATPKIILPDKSIDLASHRGEPTPWAAFTYFAKLEQLFPNFELFGKYHQTWKNFEQLHDIEACSGAAMIVRRSAIEKVGDLDERFFMYAEDLDWCRRFRDFGFRIIYYPESVVLHHKYQSGLKNDQQQTSDKARHHFFATMKQYYTKHYGHKSSLKKFLINHGVNLLKIVKRK